MPFNHRPLAPPSARFRRKAGAVVALLLSFLGHGAVAGETHLAVAANFADVTREIARSFEATTGHKVVVSFGSSGQLYAQITQGAPYDVFLSADEERPRKAVEEGLAVPESRFTYAIGRLVLWSREPDRVTGPETLKQGGFQRLAIANPATAPYGSAAIEVLIRLGIRDQVQPRLVQGNSIAQTFQFVETGNAELGFVAASQLVGRESGSGWNVPQDLHAPIRQDAVLLKRGATNEAARAFMTYLGGPEARRIIARFGYGTVGGS